MRRGALAGTPLPGGLREIDEDLKALRRVGVTLLITLTLQPLEASKLEGFGLDSLHFPIVDMEVPTPQAAAQLCEVVDKRLAEGDVIAFHCRAGLGRTGTMLAVYEIWKGMVAEEAFEAARRVHSRWIQSEQQRRFLTEFEQMLE